MDDGSADSDFKGWPAVLFSSPFTKIKLNNKSKTMDKRMAILSNVFIFIFFYYLTIAMR